MSTPLTAERSEDRTARSVSRRTGPILVATDGDPASPGAVSAAFLLAGRLDADVDVDVVAVSEPLPRYGPLVPSPELEDLVDERLLTAVHRQLRLSVARNANWPMRLLHGPPADVIARYAEQHDARLIVIGRGPRDLRHRVLGGMFATRLAHLVDTPILSVPSPFHSLLRRALVALDFSPRSTVAAREGLALLSDIASIHLAHVIPRFETALGLAEEWESAYAGGLEAAFADAEHAIRPPPLATVERVVLHGDPARELTTAASRIDADVIVCGTQGGGYVQGRLLGRVATHLARVAPCSVLLMPSANRRVQGGSDQPGADQATWTETLRRFTEHNLGRRAILEVDDPAIGAPAQVVDYAFLGAVFDQHEQRAELMLGGESAGRAHLTHSIGNVRSIEVMEGADGRDRVLRVAHEGGQTLLTLTT